MTDDEIPTLFATDDGMKPWQKPEPRTLARATDPDTSHEAAKMLAGGAGTMRRDLLRVFAMERVGGYTAEEAADYAGYTPADGAWKRVSDLLNAKLVQVDVGHERRGRSGRMQRVLRITDLGREALR